MNTFTRTLIAVAIGVCSLTGCTDRKAEQQRAADEAAAKARAENARKEMEKLPETFKPRYNKKLEPEAPKAPVAEDKAGSPTK
jgi:hypothetical protein